MGHKLKGSQRKPTALKEKRWTLEASTECMLGIIAVMAIGEDEILLAGGPSLKPVRGVAAP